MNLKQVASRFMSTAAPRLILGGGLGLLSIVPAIAQSPELQEKIAVVKQNLAENKAKLRQYQWTETTQLNLKGDDKPASTNRCQYGPNGEVQKTLTSAPPQQPSGGRLKQRVIAEKKEEMKDYMGDVKVLLAQYVPPDPQKMQQAFQAGKASFTPTGGTMNLVFKDYAQPGDQMTLTYDSAAKKITALNVDTYMGEEKDAVTLKVQMGSLPDGTNYTQRTVLNAAAKQLIVTTTNSNYQKM